MRLVSFRSDYVSAISLDQVVSSLTIRSDTILTSSLLYFSLSAIDYSNLPASIIILSRPFLHFLFYSILYLIAYLILASSMLILFCKAVLNASYLMYYLVTISNLTLISLSLLFCQLIDHLTCFPGLILCNTYFF